MKAELIADADIAGKRKIFIKEFRSDHFSHPFHFHKFYELTWIKKGYGKIIIGDYIGDFTNGELILHGAGLPHLWKCDDDFYNKKSNVHTHSISVYFPAELVKDIIDDEKAVMSSQDLLNRSQRGLKISGSTKEKVIRMIEKITNASGLEQLSYFLLMWDILANSKDLKMLAGAAYKNVSDSGDMKRFNDVFEFLFNNFSKNIMLEEVAGICHLTPSAFCRYFKARTQKSFSQVLNEIRIGHACKLLQENTDSIKNIGYECGYNNSVNFYKFFKRITKMTPGEYQKAVHSL